MDPLDAAVDSAIDSEKVDPIDAAVGSVIGEEKEQQDRDIAETGEIIKYGFAKAGSRTTGVNYLANRLGVPTTTIEPSYDKFKAVFDASKNDPRVFVERHPDLARMLRKKPWMATEVVPENIGFLEKLRRGLGALEKWRDQAAKSQGYLSADEQLSAENDYAAMRMGLPPTFDTSSEVKGLLTKQGKQLPPTPSGAELKTALQEAETPKKVEAVVDPLAKEAPGVARSIKIIAAQGRDYARQTNADDAEARYILAVLGGASQDTQDALERKAIDADISAGPPRYYGETGALTTAASDVMQAGGSSMRVLAEGGKWGVTAGSAAALGTLALTRNPSLAGKVAFAAGKVGQKAGGIEAAFLMELGSAGRQFRSTKLEDGTALAGPERIAASVLYAGFAGLVEAANEFGPGVAPLGKLGDLVAARSYKQFLKTLMTSAAGRKAVAGLAARFAKKAAGEGAEGSVQQAGQETAEWLAKSYQAGGLQEFDSDKFWSSVMEAGRSGAVGGALSGGPMALVGKATDRILEPLARVANSPGGGGGEGASAEKALALPEVAAAKLALADPKFGAELVHAETARSGEPVTHAYVDPKALLQSGIDLKTAIGEGGDLLVNGAAATGQKVEVPIEVYLDPDRFGKFAQQFAQDTALRAGHRTNAELAARDEEIAAESKRIKEQYESENPPAPDSDAEQRAMDAVEQQLAATGKVDPKDARTAVSQMRAFIRTQAVRNELNPADLFELYAVKVMREQEAQAQASPEMAKAAQMQGPVTQDAQRLSGWWAGLKPEERGRKVLIDETTGLYNARALERMKAPIGKPMIAHIRVRGTKWVNDSGVETKEGMSPEEFLKARQQGHEKGNQLFRMVGNALQAIAPDALPAKRGGDFSAFVANQDEADALAALVNEVMPVKGFDVTAVAEPIGESEAVSKAYGRAAERHDQLRAEWEKAGNYPKRGERPAGVQAATAADLTFPNQMSEIATLEPTLVDQVGKTSIEESFREVFTDQETNALTGEAFHELERQDPSGNIYSLDLDGLGDVNAKLNRDAGNRMLRAFALLAAERYGPEFRFAHLSGDEYAIASKDKAALDRFLADLKKASDALTLVYTDDATKEVFEQRGITFGAEFGATYEQADAALTQAKRASRRERPTGSRANLFRIDDRAEAQAARDAFERESDLQRGRADLARGRGRQDYGGPPGTAGRGTLEDLTSPLLPDEKLKQSPAPEVADQSPRGWMTEAARSGIKRLFHVVLTEKADLSTFLHESSHVYLEILGDLAERQAAPDSVKADWQRTLGYLGAKDRGSLTRDQKEKWARAFEAYLFEGKAPSKDLVRPFARFRAWLKNIYRTIGSLGVELNDELRGVFGRMLATDDEIARQAKAMGLRPDSEAALAAIKQIKLERREAEKWWKDETAAKEKAALEEYDRLPANLARAALEKGEIRAADGTLTAKLDVAASPDEVADIYGFETAAEMMAAINALPRREEWAAAQAKDRMREKYPDLAMDRERLEREVADALHGPEALNQLQKELEALQRQGRQGPGGVSLEAIDRAATKIIESQPVGRMSVHRFLAAERSAAQKAAVSKAKSDLEAAATYKQQQLLNHRLWREASKAIDEREKLLELAGALTKDAARKKLGKAAPVFRDGIDAILETFGLKNPEQREQQLPAINEVVAAIESHAGTVLFDPDELGRLLAQPKEWRDLTVAQMRTVGAALKNIRKVGNNASTALIDGRREDRDEVIAHLGEEAEKNLPEKAPVSSSVPAEGAIARGVSAVSSLDGELLKQETMADWLGGRDVSSWWYRAIIKPIQHAKQAEGDILKAAVKPVVQAFEKMPKAVRGRLSERVNGEELFPTHRKDIAAPTRRFELLMMALNIGNASNTQRLTEGRGITLANVLAVLNDPKTGLTKAEWDWVQSVWDANESLWPMARDLEERDSGLAPPKLDATPVLTANGALRGGYFPAVYDRRVDTVGERQAGAQAVADFMDPSFTRAGTAHGHLKSRAKNFAGVIALDPSAIYAHLAQVAHDLAFREAVKSVGSLLLDPRVDAMLKRRLGDQRARTFVQWLKDAGNGRAGIDSHARGVNAFFRHMKANAGVAILGYAADVAFGDVANLAVAGTVVKPKHLAAGYFDYFAHPKTMGEFALEKSGELRFREEGLARELQRQTKQLVGRSFRDTGPLGWYRDHAFAFMEWTDRYTSRPIWLGAYRQGLAEGRSDAEAVEFADSTIRKILPSSSAVDRAELLRDPKAGALLMFQGYANVLYNRERDVLHDAYLAANDGDGAVERTVNALGSLPKVGGQLLALWLTANVLSELLMARGPEEDEEWSQWFMRRLMLAPLYSLPFVGGPVEKWLMGKPASPRNAPALTAVDSVLKTAGSLLKDDADPAKVAEEVAKTTAVLTGLPVSKPLGAAKALFGEE